MLVPLVVEEADHGSGNGGKEKRRVVGGANPDQSCAIVGGSAAVGYWRFDE